MLALKDELAADLVAMTSLHELSTRLLASTELQPLLDEVLDATIALQNADFGNVQLYNPESQALEIVAQRGFQQDFLDHFAACTRKAPPVAGPFGRGSGSSSRTSRPIRDSRRTGRSPPPLAFAPCSPRRCSTAAASRSA